MLFYPSFVCLLLHTIPAKPLVQSTLTLLSFSLTLQLHLTPYCLPLLRLLPFLHVLHRCHRARPFAPKISLCKSSVSVCFINLDVPVFVVPSLPILTVLNPWL
ncbi:hypothetical protein BJX76DRAFT_143396 [Aspergillus varians]